jgi:hypothetical protein
MKGPTVNKPFAAILLAATALILPGCGGDTYVKVQGTTTISKGQEITDLQRALNEGAITKSEYESLRERILDRPN